ncbi:MAG: NAD(P)/FAD-dependent oxidoreductase [Bacteroidetes bacterium]|nr:NAD(P)/FAD-dependent oxidoreductase [Bacteroidota bacterium]
MAFYFLCTSNHFFTLSTTKIAIIGAGAAGCFTAANIPLDPNREVLLFEKSGKALQKVKASGGGRCNVTHHLFDIDDFSDHYPRGKQLLRKALHHFDAQATIDWFAAQKVNLKAEQDGRMFPVTNNSQTIIDAIWQRLIANGTTVLFHKTITNIEEKNKNFILHFSDQTIFEANKIVVACGGFPKIEQYKWLQKLGHSIITPVPSLFTFNLPNHPITQLMGLSVSDVSIRISQSKIQTNGDLLITHWGLSGPAVLRASAWAARLMQERLYQTTIQINWLGETTEPTIREIFQSLRKQQGAQIIQHKNPFNLPKRLWDYLLQNAGINEKTRWGELHAAQQNKLIEMLIRHHFTIHGKTTYKEEFVTCGGIPLSEINPQTMESRCKSGIYFSGEILDVDGLTGGFNFQHAWSSAFLAAKAISANT